MKISLKGHKLPTPQVFVNIANRLRLSFVSLGGSSMLTGYSMKIGIALVIMGEAITFILNCIYDEKGVKPNANT